MMVTHKFGLLLLSAAAAVSAQQQTCSENLPITYKTPVVRAGYTARVIANNLTDPRGIMFDSAGNLLVLQNGAGIVALTLTDEGGACVKVASKKLLSDTKDVTHSIDQSLDGKQVYVTDVENMFAIDYDASTLTLATTNKTLINGMTGTDHISRTILVSKKVPGRVLINRGSFDNVDLVAADMNSGHSNIRSFDITKSVPYNFTSGDRISWGTRNSVGIAEHPITGGIWSVENSVDNLQRGGQNIHENNPGEELNFHGYLNGTATQYTGKNYGYPYCFTAWNVSGIPNNSGLQVGSAFAMDSQQKQYDDKYCKEQTIAPRLTFPAHWAPLDIKFNTAGTTAWVTAHGSWNRDTPDGYNLFQLAYDPTTGQPLQPPTSTSHVIEILSNPSLTDCPESCFRPVSLAWDKKGRLYMSSDLTGEIFIITKSDGSGVDDISAPANTTIANGVAGGGGAVTTSSTSAGTVASAVPSRAMAMAGIEADINKRALICAGLGAACYGWIF